MTILFLNRKKALEPRDKVFCVLKGVKIRYYPDFVRLSRRLTSLVHSRESGSGCGFKQATLQGIGDSDVKEVE